MHWIVIDFGCCNHLSLLHINRSAVQQFKGSAEATVIRILIQTFFCETNLTTFSNRILSLFSAESSEALIRDNGSENDIAGRNHKFAEATQKEWKKCAALKESTSDITTQEEFYKFDFQVICAYQSN